MATEDEGDKEANNSTAAAIDRAEIDSIEWAEIDRTEMA
jgi:hypothetical protein